MDKHKLVLPISILFGCIILGGFYYASEANKQKSIERQQQADQQAITYRSNAELQEKQAEQQADLQAKQDAQQVIIDQNNLIASQKIDCANEATQGAIRYNKDSCDRGDYCLKGDNVIPVVVYNNAYSACLERKGLK